MAISILLLILAQLAAAQPAGPASPAGNDPYKPLELYNGSWRVHPGTEGHATDLLVDRCTRMPHFYACEQTVNGDFKALVLFVPLEQSGKYHTQALSPDGHAYGIGDLEIHRDHWTYSSKDVDAGQDDLVPNHE